MDIEQIRKLRDEATPGPWADEMDCIAGGPKGLRRSRPNGEVIGRMRPSIDDLLSQDERNANAKLAAAAPDLADTAIALYERLEQGEIQHDIKARDKRIRELEAERDAIGNHAVAVLSSQLCEKHSEEVKGQTFSEFQTAESIVGCSWCLKAERDRLREQACPLKPCDYYNAALAEGE